MQFPESWLRTLVKCPLSTDELATKLTMAGLEVEEVKPVAPPFTHVVVGEVVEKDKHPDADRLSVCKVKVDDGAPRQIVCGASNVAVGVKVPCALPGAVLPGDFKIKPTTMRGVASEGMLCAAKELGINADSEGLMLLSPTAKVGQDIRYYLNLDDKLFTLKMTPNRADCLSLYGVAKEVAAITNSQLVPYDFSANTTEISNTLKVINAAPNLCGRFAGRVIRDVNNAVKTPLWIAERLERSGQRCVNPLVDISNYVMLELGRPTHVFDLNKLSGSLSVRWAQQDEELVLLNEEKTKLSSNFGVIADDNGPQALAGVMGGLHTSVTTETKNIFIEAAFWYPNAITGRTRELNISSEAAHRFERGVDPSTIVDHLEWMTRLILQVCGGKIGPIEDQDFDWPRPKPVTMRHRRCEKIIGMSLSDHQIKEVFDRLKFAYQVKTNDNDTVYSVTAPASRFDIQIEEDLVEEVIRLVGYENLPSRPSVGKLTMLAVPEAFLSRNQLRHRVAALGYQEVVSYSFTPKQWETDFSEKAGDVVGILNPIASHLDTLRTTLTGSLLSVLRHNLGHRVDRLRIFEVARTFCKNTKVTDTSSTVSGYSQVWKVGGLAYGLADRLQWASGQRQIDFFDVKGDLEQLLNGKTLEFKTTNHPAFHPGRSARVFEHGQEIGFIGEIHPKHLKPYDLPNPPIVFELELQACVSKKIPSFQAISKQPVVIRDVAFVVENTVTVKEIKKAITAGAQSKKNWLKSVILFDEFIPKQDDNVLKLNEKSLAFRMRFQAEDQSLNDELLSPLLDSIVKQVQATCNARIR